MPSGGLSGICEQIGMSCWTRKLPEPTPLKNGRPLSTLADARALMLALPDATRRKELWIYTAGLMYETANGRGGMTATVASLTRRLKDEGLI